MACSGCGRRKIIHQSTNVTYQLNSTPFNPNDFISINYLGEGGNVIGPETNINYGVKETNDVFLIHISDYNHESNNEEVIFEQG
jgi:hypothetical protein